MAMAMVMHHWWSWVGVSAITVTKSLPLYFSLVKMARQKYSSPVIRTHLRPHMYGQTLIFSLLFVIVLLLLWDMRQPLCKGLVSSKVFANTESMALRQPKTGNL